MASKVEIANKALAHLGIAPITSLEEDSEPARQINAIFNTERDIVLKGCDWNFARKTEALALLADSSLEWDYVYQRPAKCLQVRRIFSEVTASPTEEGDAKHEEAVSSSGSQAILTDIEDAYMKYTYQVTDVSVMPADFAEALAFKLAASSAMALTGEKSLRADMTQFYMGALGIARKANGNEGKSAVEPQSQYLDARG